jgi:alkaline phosphatase D
MSRKQDPKDTLSSLSRRRLLQGAAGTLTLAAAPAFVHAIGDPEAGSLFTLGVASGDPDANSVGLWTRLAPNPLAGGGLGRRNVPVSVEVALDPGFINVIRTRKFTAQARHGHVVNVRVGGLPPNTPIYYRFGAMGQASRVGCTRTFPRPADLPEHLRFAVVSCQNYQQGFYTAYADMLSQDVDFVLHTGDYIYEGGPTSAVIDPSRVHNSAEIFSVEDYRNRYALYRLDPDLQAMHAAVPFLVTWDDHEVDNNYAGLVEENGEDVDVFAARRRNAYQVYQESMPLGPGNEVLRGNGELRIYRSLPYGRLADIHILDTRQYRTDQPAGDNFGSTDQLSPVDAATLEAVFGETLFDTDGILDPGATLLGLKQEAWLARQLKQSKANWNVLAQQIMATQWNLVTTGRLSAQLGSFPNPLPPPVSAALGELETLISVDAWDGYVAARERLFRIIDETDPSNPVVLTGDIHSSWAANLLSDFDDPASQIVAAEFVCSSIASTFLALDPRPTHEIVRRGVEADNPHIEYFNGVFRGYALCDVDYEEWITTYRAVGDVADLGSINPLAFVPFPGTPVETDAIMRIASGFREANGRINNVFARPMPDFLPFLP